jgi:hypothetical protein
MRIHQHTTGAFLLDVENIPTVSQDITLVYLYSAEYTGKLTGYTRDTTGHKNLMNVGDRQVWIMLG